MAPTGWAAFGAWHDDPAVALEALQHFLLASGKHKAAFTSHQAKVDHLQRTLTRLAAEGNDPVAEILRDQYAAQLETVKARPEPEDPAEKLAWFRWLNAPEGTGSAIDLEGVSSVPTTGRAAPLSDAELTKVFGTTRPGKDQIEPLANVLLNLRPAGQATWIVVWDDDQPVGYFFIGVTGT